MAFYFPVIHALTDWQAGYEFLESDNVCASAFSFATTFALGQVAKE